MKVITTFGEILRRGDWNAFCEDKGLNPYCIKEGLAESSEEVTLSWEEAIKYNIIEGK